MKTQDKVYRLIWQNLHLALDAKTHGIIDTDLSFNNVTVSDTFLGLIRQTHRKIRSAAADRACDNKIFYMDSDVKNQVRLSLPKN